MSPATGVLSAISTAPAATYRLQIHAGFTFDDAAAQVERLADLGVSHVFVSPILQAAPGSTHGYDVVDHSRVSREAGGREGFERLAETAHAHGLGVVVDVVPNHMAVPTPLWHNRALWSVLREGTASPYAEWFDMDLSGEHPVLMPVLGDKIGTVLTDGPIGVEQREIPSPDGGVVTEPCVVYYDHVFPVVPGTENLPLADLLDRQWYRLAHWKVGDDELNYRRFFDVDSLAALRVERPAVFDATHALLLELFHDGLIDAFRIDHPDGLADPRGYLRRLREATDGAWVVVEKILQSEEELPGDFACAGTTGYDSLLRVGGLFHDAAGAMRLTELWQHVSGVTAGFPETVEDAKRHIVADSLYAEVDRLTTLAHTVCQRDIRLRDHTRRQLHRCLLELLVAMDRYRAYIVPGEPAPRHEREVIEAAARRAQEHLEDDERDTLDLVVSLLCGDEVGSAGRSEEDARAELIVRFQQTCGPVMAKSTEDTAFYRWHRFVAVNEVGSEPTLIGVAPDDFHDFCRHLLVASPETMTTLSTHDTKRAEDVRGRLAVLTEAPREWEATVDALRRATQAGRPDLLDGATEYLLWQTLLATWRLPGTAAGAAPITDDRLTEYLTKAMREAKTHTTWTDQDPDYEAAVLGFARALLRDEGVAEILDEFVRRTATGTRAALLGQKLVQLTMPGVPDVYQGTELVDLSLVDPDNRRPVDHAARAELLAELDGGARPDGLDAEKLQLTAAALRVRRSRPDAFRGRSATYGAVASTSGHAVAFTRGTEDGGTVAITVATRLAQALSARGGWHDHQLILPEGSWRDLLSDRVTEGGTAPLAELLADSPVALLVPHDTAPGTEAAADTATGAP